MILEGLSDTYKKCNMLKNTHTVYVEVINTCMPIFVLIDMHTKEHKSALQPAPCSFHKIVLFCAEYGIDV